MIFKKKRKNLPISTYKAWYSHVRKGHMEQLDSVLVAIVIRDKQKDGTVHLETAINTTYVFLRKNLLKTKNKYSRHELLVALRKWKNDRLSALKD